MSEPELIDCSVGKNWVSFRTYCETMKPFGLTGFCDELQSDKATSWSSIPSEVKLCQEGEGDGTVSYRGLTQGSWTSFSPQRFFGPSRATPDVFKRAVFIAGAFGVPEMNSIYYLYSDLSDKDFGIFREDLPIKLIEGIQALYAACSKEGAEKCLKDARVGELVTALKSAMEYFEPRKNESKQDAIMRELSGRLAQLKENYALMKGRIKNSARLKTAVAPFLKGIPKDPKTEEDLRAAIGNYRQMVKRAIMFAYGMSSALRNVEKVERNLKKGIVKSDDDYEAEIYKKANKLLVPMSTAKVKKNFLRYSCDPKETIRAAAVRALGIITKWVPKEEARVLAVWLRQRYQMGDTLHVKSEAGRPYADMAQAGVLGDDELKLGAKMFRDDFEFTYHYRVIEGNPALFSKTEGAELRKLMKRENLSKVDGAEVDTLEINAELARRTMTVRAYIELTEKQPQMFTPDELSEGGKTFLWLLGQKDFSEYENLDPELKAEMMKKADEWK